MAGLRKAKKYDWKDSNLALFGSDTEKQVKKESAESEPAWKHAGEKIGLQIWRVVKFQIESWPEEDYGKFYSGDSYIILNTYDEDPDETYKDKDSDELLFDVHFWIGKHSTQDEYGTAAYKTVELDTFLDDKPIQHREVQQHESSLFKSYFKDVMYLEGGADTGFRKVKPEEYKPRVFHIKKLGRNNIVSNQVTLRKTSDVASDDVYILDGGLKIYLWKGNSCNFDEVYKATQVLSGIKSERGGKPATETLEEASDGMKIFEEFLDDGDEDEVDSGDFEDDEDQVKELFRLTDSDGSLDFEVTGDTNITKGDFREEDVFIFDTKKDCFVWVGKSASPDEKKNAMSYAHKYLMKTRHPLIPVTIMKSGRETKDFRNALAA